MNPITPCGILNQELDQKEISINSKINDINSLLGTKTDYVDVPYNYGDNSILGFLVTGYYHVHGQAAIYPDKANAVILTSGSGAWSASGSIIEVIPENGLNTAAFDLHWINIQDISANSQFVIDIYAGLIGSEVLIGSTRGWRSSNFIAEGAKRIQIPQQPAGTRISCKLSDSTSGTITAAVSFEGHYYA